VSFAKDVITNDLYSDQESNVMTTNVQSRTVSHQSASAKRYDQTSKRVPAYYNRPGPGLYDNNSNLDKLSKFETTTGPKIVKSIDSSGFFVGKSPQHRFTEFEKAKICVSNLE
jgi:hypothetical protein